jgi:uncharacterized membrane-anchored protein YhcB (DUF1043 family)
MGMGSVVCMYIDNSIGVIIGMCLGYAIRILVERVLSRASITSRSLEELDVEWENLKRRVDETFGPAKTDPKPRKK